MVDSKSPDSRKRRVISDAKRPELRLRLEAADQDLLAELALFYGTPGVEATRRAIRNEVDRIRESRNADRLDTLRGNVVSLQESLSQLARRVEASIEINRAIEKRILEAVEKVELVSSNSGVRLMALIETFNPERVKAIDEKLKEILARS